MQILFGQYLAEVVNAGIEPPDFIRLTRERHPAKASMFECKDNELLGYYPINNPKNEFLSTHYVRISTSNDQEASPFQEIVYLDNFKMETAYFVLNEKWKNLKSCFDDLVINFALEDWIDIDPDSSLKPNLPDFIRLIRIKDNRFMDFFRDKHKYVKIEYEPGHYGGEILSLTNEFAQEFEKNNGIIQIYTASFNDHSKNTRTSNRFKE